MSEGRRHLNTERHDRVNRPNYWARSFWGSRKAAKEVMSVLNLANVVTDIMVP